MALAADDLRAQLNGVPETDAFLNRKLAAATAFIEAQLGYKLTDTVALPGGAPADLEEAILMLAAHLYENRESTIVAVSAAVMPMGVEEIVANYRRYTFGYIEESANG